MNGLAPRPRRLFAVLAAVFAVVLAGCGGGGDTTSAGGAKDGAVANSQLAQKIGLESNGENQYRLGGCTAKAVLSSPGAIKKAKEAGQKIVTDPTGVYGIEIEEGGRCARVMKEAVAILNVP
jgi:hypothetical protein